MSANDETTQVTRVLDSTGHPVAFAQVQRSLYPVLVVLFVAVLLISNIAAVKLIQVGPLILDGGAFLFPLAYILGDVLSEVYGWKATR